MSNPSHAGDVPQFPFRAVAGHVLFVLLLLDHSAASLTAAQGSSRLADSAARWWPTLGHVILAGGGLAKETADALADRLIALAGGPEALIVVIPTASVELASLPASGPPPALEAIQRHLESRGAKQVVFMHTRDRNTANSADFVKTLRSANGVLLTGGAFRVLDDIYHGTLVEREIKGVLERGGVVAGDSAGAITLGCFWLGWDASKKLPVKLTDGLCVLPGVTVTPHLEKMGGDERTADVLTYLSSHPGTVGINIQENTFVVAHGGEVSVVGKGVAFFVNAAPIRSKGVLKLSGGERHDFGQ